MIPNQMKLTWLKGKIARITKDLFLLGLNFLHKLNKNHFRKSLDSRLQNLEKLFNLIIDLEYCSDMKRKWGQIKDLLILISDGDGAYRKRMLLILNLITLCPENFAMRLYEAQEIKKLLWIRGYRKLSRQFWNFQVYLNKIMEEKDDQKR